MLADGGEMMCGYHSYQPAQPKTADELYEEKKKKEKKDVRDRQVPNLRR